MARARGWHRRRTLGITAVCGAGHLIASLALGAVGVAAGLAISDVERLQAGRGRLAGWLLIGFGLAYLAWGIKRAISRRPHSHWHGHSDGTLHHHRHIHAGGHLHAHDANEPRAHTDVPLSSRAQSRDLATTTSPHPAHPSHPARSRNITPWILFTIFLFGPCEPLIPLLMVPAAGGNWWHVALVAGAFSAATLAAMLGAVTIGLAGLEHARFAKLERYSDALAGAAVTVCGLLVNFGL